MVHILVVDDEKEFLDFAAAVLTRVPDSQVHSTMHTDEAFRIIEAHKPQILLLDYTLKEELGGLDVLKKALSVDPKAKGFIISGNNDPNFESICLKAGAAGFIEKPIPSVRDLLDTIQKAAQEFK